MNEERVSQEAREGLIERARQMRKEPTNAEALLWARLRKRQLGGLKFRRQHINQYFIVDFYCPRVKLAIEIDGPVHDEQEEYDQEREKILQELGYQVVRFKNADVENNLDLVVAGITDLCRRRIDLIDDITNDKAM
jgi:leucyl-tRNA synthetase